MHFSPLQLRVVINDPKTLTKEIIYLKVSTGVTIVKIHWINCQCRESILVSLFDLLVRVTESP